MDVNFWNLIISLKSPGKNFALGKNNHFGLDLPGGNFILVVRVNGSTAFKQHDLEHLLETHFNA